MFRQVGIGAATVLSIGLLAAGCSEDGDTIISGGGTILQNTDSTPFSGVTNNNLSSDGGGFTGNGANWTNWSVMFNCDSGKSDGTFSGDGSAIVLYTDANNRVFASHFADGSFTPPVELEAADKRSNGGTAPSIDSYVMIPLNTANYQSANSSPATEVNTVRQNAGNWLIVGDFQTNFTQPGQSVDNASSIGKGRRQTIASWVFLKSLRDQSKGTSAAVGGTTREFRYGFQRFGDEIPTAITAGALTGSGTTVNRSVPACNVMSYGVVTDGLAGQANFGGNGEPWTGGLFGRAQYSVDAPTYDAAQYTPGEDVSVLAVVYTQIETSASTSSLRLSTTNSASAATGTGNRQNFLRYRTFNLATLTWGTEARITTGIDTNDGTEGTEMGEGVRPDFHVYNNTVFFNYMDASMKSETATTGFSVDRLDIQEAAGGQHNANRVMIAAARFTDGQNGSSTINTINSNNALDISTDVNCLNGSAAGVPGSHSTNVPSLTTTVGSTNPAPSWEDARFFDYTGSAQTQSIYGPDEGLEEISLFYTLADNTASGSGLTGSGPNADSELAVVAINKGSSTLTTSSFVTGTNPLRISGNHATDNEQNTSSSTVSNSLDDTLSDPIIGAKFLLNRTGRWIATAFTRKTGTNGNANTSPNSQDLYVNLYQPFRLTASTTGGGTGGTAATMQTRVLAAGPSIVDNANLSINPLGNDTGFGNQLPVNTFTFQGGACYRGRQSAENIVNLFWEQSDNTGDRVFGARLDVTLSTSNAPATAPSFTSAPSSVELVPGTNVVGHAAFINTNGTPGTSSFNFITGNGDVTDGRFWQAVDSGSDTGSSTATLGNCLIVFARVDDATSADSGSNDLGDMNFYATVFNGTQFETPTQFGTTADTNEILDFANGTDDDGLTAQPTTATASPTAATAYNRILNSGIDLDSLVALVNNTNITAKTSFPAAGDTGYFVVLFKDREATLTTASGGTTTTVVGSNASSRLAQFARRISFVNSTANPAVSTISSRFFPSVVNTATSPFALPIQLDHAQGVSTDAGTILTAQNGTALAVVMLFDNQIWYQATEDGEQWLFDSSTGLPNPGLISNFSSADVSAGPELNTCTDDNGDEGAAILLYSKQDIQGTTRGFAATRSN